MVMLYRLLADLPEVDYKENESSGADVEVNKFNELGKPVFFSITDLYQWVDNSNLS